MSAMPTPGDSQALLIRRVQVATYRVPTDEPESDGTFEWNHTDVVVVQVEGGGATGLGLTYASTGTAAFVDDILRPELEGHGFASVEQAWSAMHRKLRNAAVPGAGSMAIAAVDIALWDLRAKLLGVALVDLWGAVRDGVAVYGSGGFTSYSERELCAQLTRWADLGLANVKMKVGRDPDADLKRVGAVREAIGPEVGLFVDANGAYGRKQALDLGQRFADLAHITWFEEPRPSTDLDGLRMLRERAPAGQDIAAGEYGDTLGYFRAMLEAEAVDCLQADVTRCGGFTGFRKVGALCEAFEVPLSAHCAPQLHCHVGATVAPLRHVEYFHDHVRIDQMLFDGLAPLEAGRLQPVRGRPGHGLILKPQDAARYRL